MLLLTAVAPTIALLCYFYKRDKYEREPRRLLLKAFLMGCVSVIPVIFVELQLNLFENADESLIAAGYTAFIVAGLVEEAFKYLVFYHYIWKHREFDEMYDGIIYCVFISLGFATVENIGYVVGSGFSTAFIRAMTAVPAHALFGVAMGYMTLYCSHKDFIFLAIFVPYMLYLWRRGLRNVDELVEASPYKRYPEEENE